MGAQQLFGVVVRAFGLWFILVGFEAMNGVIQVFGLRSMNQYDLNWQPAVAFAALYWVAGLVLLRKSELIVQFTYGPQASKPPDNSD